MLRAVNLWILLYLLFSVNLFAQQARIDSVRSQIPLLQGKEKVDAINSLTRGLMYTTPDEAMELTIQATQLSEEIDYLEGKVMSLINQGVVLNGKSLYLDAEDVLNEAKRLAVSIGFQRGEAYANLSLVTIQMRKSDYDKAVELSFAGINLAKKMGSVDLEVSNLINIASVKQSLKDYTNAQRFLLEAWKLAETNPEISEIRKGQINGSLGIASAANKDYGIALTYFQEALRFFETANSQAQIANVLLNMGYSYAELGEVAHALQHYDHAEAIWTTLNNQRSLAIILKNRGELMISAGQPTSAIDILNEALAKEAFMDDLLISEIYGLLAQASERLSEHRAALNYYKKYVALNDSISDRATERNIAQMTEQFELQKLSTEKELQLQQFEIENLKISKSRQMILVVAVVLLLLVFWAVWNRNKLKNKLVMQEKDRLIARQEMLLQQHNFESENERLVAYANGLLSRNETLEKKTHQLEEQLEGDPSRNLEVEELVDKMHVAINGDKDWAAFVIYFEAAYPHFFSMIETKKKVGLTTSEQRLLALLKINLSNKEIASLLNISSGSVIRAKYRLKQKLGFVEAKEMLGFLADLA